MPENTSHSGARTSKTIAYYLSFVIVGMVTASFGPSLPSFAANTGASLAGIGGLFIFHRIGYMTGSLGGGAFLDRLPGKYVLVAAMSIVACGLFLIPQWAMLLGLFATILVIGLAQGTAEVAANTGVVWLHGENAGPVMNGLHLSFGVGAIVAPVIVSQSSSRLGSLQPGYWLLAALAVGAALWWLRLPQEHRDVDVEENKARHAETDLVVLFSLLLFLVIAGEAGFAGWIYSYAVGSELMPAAVAGYLTSAFWASLTIGRFLGIDLVRRLGTQRLLVLNLIGCVLAMTVFLVFADRPAGAWTAAALLGLAQASIVPATFTLAGKVHVLTGSTGGIFVASSSAGGMALPWIVGQLFESVGPIIMVWLVFASQVLALFVFLAIVIRLRAAGT